MRDGYRAMMQTPVWPLPAALRRCATMLLSGFDRLNHTRPPRDIYAADFATIQRVLDT
jgi:hypothetical protein